MRVFELLKESPSGRAGLLTTLHGAVPTPLFMPVGTAGAMKGLTHDDIIALGAQLLLANTYHLHLRPGEDIVAEAGGLHAFINWDRPMLTDSGGFQVFSLRSLSSIDDHGVTFQSHLDGSSHFLGPAESITIQHKLGADIIMCFDQCPPSKASRADIVAAVDRTLRWAADCKRTHEEICRNTGRRPLLFGIVQGGLERDLRERCAEELQAIGFDGYAIGGLAVGESEEEMYAVLDGVLPHLPRKAPRYLMGVGRISQMRTAIAKGVDMFDCVLPMREARHGTITLTDGSRIRILNAQYVHDHSPIDSQSPSVLSRRHKKSYLNHLLRSNERFGETIACMQNLGVTLKELRDIREEILTH